MPRVITARMGEALRLRKPLALLAQIDHPDGLQRLWTGIGTLAYNSFDWTGVGKLGSISPVRRSTDIAIQEVVFGLTGISPDTVTWLSSNVRNREATAWLACIDGSSVVPDPLQLINVLLDYQVLNIDDSGKAAIELHALSGFYTLQRALNEVWSSQDQQRAYPFDTGFDMIDSLQTEEVKWTAS